MYELFSTLNFRAMGKHPNRKWLHRKLNVKSLHFQSATWVADIGHPIKVDDDALFEGYCSLCEPELFPGSRLISLKEGAKVNVFNSGKCIFLGKYFRTEPYVYHVLSKLAKNI